MSSFDQTLKFSRNISKSTKKSDRSSSRRSLPSEKFQPYTVETHKSLRNFKSLRFFGDF